MKFWPIFPSRRSGKSAGAGPVDPEGWQPGDQAECIGNGNWFDLHGRRVAGPKTGQVLKVAGVHDGWSIGEQGKVLGLSFAAFPGESYVAKAFRKVRPRSDEATAADAEFTALVRRPPEPVMPRETIEECQ